MADSGKPLKDAQLGFRLPADIAAEFRKVAAAQNPPAEPAALLLLAVVALIEFHREWGRVPRDMRLIQQAVGRPPSQQEIDAMAERPAPPGSDPFYRQEEREGLQAAEGKAAMESIKGKAAQTGAYPTPGRRKRTPTPPERK